MRFTTKRVRAERFFVAAVLVASLAGGGCSRIMNWADGIGNHMPTYQDRRCEDRNFCWKTEQTITATPQQMQARRRTANAAKEAKENLPAGPVPWPGPDGAAPQEVQPPAPGMTPQPLAEPAYVPPAMPYPDTQAQEMQAEERPVRLPANEEEAVRMAEEGKMGGRPQGYGGIPAEDAPPGMPKEMLEGDAAKPIPGLKSYEQAPPWANDNPPVPVLEQVKEFGW